MNGARIHQGQYNCYCKLSAYLNTTYLVLIFVFETIACQRVGHKIQMFWTHHPIKNKCTLNLLYYEYLSKVKKNTALEEIKILLDFFYLFSISMCIVCDSSPVPVVFQHIQLRSEIKSFNSNVKKMDSTTSHMKL